MCTILPGDGRHIMCVGPYLCVQYLLMTTEIICLHVCISVHHANWWRQKWYVCISVFMCTILAGDDRNNMPACLYLCVQYFQVATEIICLHVCIYVYNTSRWRQTYYVRKSVFMCTILAGDDRNSLPRCLYFCAQYLLVTTEMSACLYLCVVYLLVTTEIICLHVCIYVCKTSRWWQT